MSSFRIKIISDFLNLCLIFKFLGINNEVTFILELFIIRTLYFCFQEEAEFHEIKNYAAATGYENVLQVTNSDYLATGYYECSDSKFSAKTYVYVSDPKNLLAVRPEDTMLLRVQYQDVIVPCKPTSPLVAVTLHRDNELVCFSFFFL